MALKFNITKTEFDKLPDIIKEEYNEGDNGYSLDVTGIEDTGALKRARDREKTRASDLLKKLDVAETELEALRADPASKQVVKLEETWKKKYDTDLAVKDTEIVKLSAFAKSTLADSIALGLAKEISIVPDLLLPEISKRIVADLKGDKPTTKILDKDGKESSLTLDDLKTELLADTRFSAILIASKAKGGASGRPAIVPSGASGRDNPNEKVDLTRADPAVLVSRIEARIAARKKG